MPESAKAGMRAASAEGPRSGGRLALPRQAGFWVLACAYLLVFTSAAAASPLYHVYQAEWRFSATTLTAIFATYVLVLLVTLLFFGSISDYVGRRVVVIAALIPSVAACAVFLMADGVAALYAGRALQGAATGLASGAVGAGLIELQPAGTDRAAVVTSAFSGAGLAIGALVTSLLVQFAPAPTHLIWWLLLGAFIVEVTAVSAIKEPGTPRPGALASLQPRARVPRQARATFWSVAPCFAAVWALGGFYLSLGPSLALELAASRNIVWGGLVIFLLTGTGATASFTLRRMASSAAMLVGCGFLLAGLAITISGIATTTSAAFLAGSAVAGVGFGLAFLGSFRMIVALAGPDDRASIVAATFVVSYLAFSIPALIAGVATSSFGLHSTALVYSACVAGLVVVAGVLLLTLDSLRRSKAAAARGTEPPPAPCTVPPCRQALDAARNARAPEPAEAES